MIAWVRSERALRLATISARTASTAPSRPFGAPRAWPDWAARAAPTGSSGSDFLDGAGPVGRTAYLDDLDAGGRQVAGQAGAVAAGALDPDQAHRPESAQPAQQPALAYRADRELPDAGQPADRIERGGDVGIGVGVHAAGNRACLYDGHCHPFSLR